MSGILGVTHHGGLDAANAEARQHQRTELVAIGPWREADQRDATCRQIRSRWLERIQEKHALAMAGVGIWFPSENATTQGCWRGFFPSQM
jgi:hypothetical protein